jgi:hypothetical protein
MSLNDLLREKALENPCAVVAHGHKLMEAYHFAAIVFQRENPKPDQTVYSSAMAYDSALGQWYAARRDAQEKEFRYCYSKIGDE